MRTILIVDDETLVRLAIRSLADWASYGYDLRLEAGNGLQAMDILAREPVDLVVTDLKMPGMDGFGLMKAMGDAGFTIPVVVLSAYNDYESVRRAFKLGARDYIVKTEMRIESILGTFADALADAPEPPQARERPLQQEETLLALVRGETPKERPTLDELGWRAAAQLIVLLSPLEPPALDSGDAERHARVTQGIHGLLEQTLKSFEGAAYVQTAPEEYCLLLTFDTLDLGKQRTQVEALISRLQGAMHTYFNLRLAVGISASGVRFSGIAEQYREAQHDLREQLRQSAKKRAPAVKAVARGYSQAVTDALAFMQENYAEEITLKTISEHVCLSESYFSALFSREVKASFVDTLTSIRIQHAKVLLQTTHLKVYEVAAQVGFLSNEHFCRMFKKSTGTTPHAYKNASRSQP